MKITDFLRSIVQQLPGPPAFGYMGKYEHNANDDLDYNLARVNLFEIEQPGFKRNNTAGALQRRYPLFIEFVKLADESLTAEQRDVIVQDMIELAAILIDKVADSGLFDDLPEVINGVTVINRYDQNVVGYEVNLPLVSSVPIELC